MIDNPASLSAIFVIGLAGGMHCVGMCGGIVAALSFGAKTMTPRMFALRSMLYHLGRIGGYMTLGFLFGLLGQTVQQNGSLIFLQRGLAISAGLMMIFFAFYIVGLIPAKIVSLPGLNIPATLLRNAAQKGSPTSWWLVGVANGFLPCGLVYAMLPMALNADSGPQGALIMLFFGAGSVVPLAATALLARRLTPTGRATMVKVAAIIIALLGLVTIYRGLAMTGAHITA